MISPYASDVGVADILRLVATGVAISIAGAVTAASCGSLAEAGKNVPFRPPGFIFAIVWPILYVTTGIAWRESGRKGGRVLVYDSIFACLVGLLCVWLLTYTCFDLKRVSIGILISALVLSAALGVVRSKWTFPLTAWLAFASSISIYEEVHA